MTNKMFTQAVLQKCHISRAAAAPSVLRLYQHRILTSYVRKTEENRLEVLKCAYSASEQ